MSQSLCILSKSAHSVSKLRAPELVSLQSLPSLEQLRWDSGATYVSTFLPRVWTAKLVWNDLTLENTVSLCIFDLNIVYNTQSAIIYNPPPSKSCGLIPESLVMFQMDSKKCKAKTNLFASLFVLIGGTVRSWLIKQGLFSHVGLELLSDLILFPAQLLLREN